MLLKGVKKEHFERENSSQIKVKEKNIEFKNILNVKVAMSKNYVSRTLTWCIKRCVIIQGTVVQRIWQLVKWHKSEVQKPLTESIDPHLGLSTSCSKLFKKMLQISQKVAQKLLQNSKSCSKVASKS